MASNNTELVRPDHWVVGKKKAGWTVVRVRAFFAVLKGEKDGKTTWAMETITGKITPAKSSAEAGEKGRAYRDAQQAKGATVKRTSAPAKKAAAAPAKKAAAPAKKAAAKKATTAKAPAKTAAKKAAAEAPAAKRRRTVRRAA